MVDAPLTHPSTWLIITAVVSPLIGAVLHYDSSGVRHLYNTELFLRAFWLIGAATALFVMYLIFFDRQPEILQALPPFILLVAAFIASASMMKSIQSASKLHNLTSIKDRNTELIYAATNLKAILKYFRDLQRDALKRETPIYKRDKIVKTQYITSKYIEKLDQKKLFYCLREDETTQLQALLLALQNLDYLLNHEPVSIGANLELGRKIAGFKRIIKISEDLLEKIEYKLNKTTPA